MKYATLEVLKAFTLPGQKGIYVKGHYGYLDTTSGQTRPHMVADTIVKVLL